MTAESLVRKLEIAVPAERILPDEPLAGHCSFKVGGPADLFIQVRTQDELRQVLPILREAGVEVFFLGRGTNLLIGDRGFRGAVVCFCADSTGGEAGGGEQEETLQSVSVDGKTIRAGAGASLHRAAAEACRASLTGLEFAAGIPGTIGGGIVMNAGAYGGEMKQVVTEVTVLTESGEICTYSNEEMEFGYRTSRLKREPSVVLSVVMQLRDGEQKQIEEKMADLARQRREKQPLEYPSAGSTFKRPEGYFAGKLIEDAGLKGFAVGGAEVSVKHSGFVINRGGASAAEIRSLIEQVQQRVYEDAGVRLEREVIYLGEFD